MKTEETREASIEELVDKLKDHKWRLNNLYYIRDTTGTKVPFKLNQAQEWLIDNLWYMNIVVKARQLGMCLDPDTKVLTSSLEWVKIKDITVGTEIISVDEFPKGSKQGRRMQTGVVEGVVTFKRDTYRLHFDDDTSMVCTGKHPWLSKRNSTDTSWMTIEGEMSTNRNKASKNKITVGTKIRRITNLWDGETSYEDGWVGGMIDGEGSLSLPSRAGSNLSISQVDGPVWERLVEYFKNNNYSYRVESDTRTKGLSSKLGSKVVNKIVLSRTDEIMRLLGKTKPSRFAGRNFWEGKELPSMGQKCWVSVTKIEHIGEGEVVDLQTSRGTYIAEGLISHNTTFFTLFYLDQVLFSENKKAGIIAHRQEDMKRIFRDKVMFALKNLPDWVKKYVGEPVVDTANELVFENGGSIFVSMSTRSQTPNFLHISEYGYVCAHAPEKAEEILHGAINSVHAGQMVSIESTAEGREGHFYRLAMMAEKMRKEGKKLTPLDFKMVFFPWYMDPDYELKDAGHIIMSSEYKEYFTLLDDKHGIKLTDGQKHWYIKKKDMMGEGIYAQFPSFLEEAFQISLDGSYYAKEMSRVYAEKRIGFFPVDPKHEVNTVWDLGMNDQNVITFFQVIGEEIRFVDYIEDSGYGLDYYVKELSKLPYRYGRHILPWDASVRDLTLGIEREKALWDMGLRNTYVVPKTGINDGIEKVRQIFHKFRFHEEKTKMLTDNLFNYRRDFDTSFGVWKNTPRHDGSSHSADCIRTLAVAWETQGMNYNANAKVEVASFTW